MAATSTNIRDFFKLNTALPVLTAKHATRIIAMLADDPAYNVDEDGDPRTPIPDDFLDWLYRRTRAAANKVTTKEAKATVDAATVDILG